MQPVGDQLNIDTPELVDIEMPLAGIGSRFIAILVDYLIWGSAFFIFFLLALIVIPAMSIFGRISANWAIGIALLIVFVMHWGYFALFEAFSNGRTPGKRVAKIRVIHQSGRGINFVEALARNLVRFVDSLPSFYAIGIVVIFLSRRNQRLGDMVAGTLVVRDREVDSPHWGESASRTFTAPTLIAASPITQAGSSQTSPGPWADSRADSWDRPPHLRVVLPATALAKLSGSDLEVLEGFFGRRLDMDLATRSALASRIASALCAKSGLAIPQDTSVETFLEAVAHQFREQARMS
jgi:uncharacterized RDD family membrane protein YckC